MTRKDFGILEVTLICAVVALFAFAFVIRRLRGDTATAFMAMHQAQVGEFKAVREEQHQIACAILEQVQAQRALPEPRKPQGKAGFGANDPEPLG